jgi:hypothetical protein
MTSQTKYYIDLSDIAALRFECRHCGATLTLDARKNFSTPPRTCVNCKEDLWPYEDATIERAIVGLVENLKLWQRLMDNPDRIAFNFMLEVKGEAALEIKKTSAHGASRDSGDGT